MAETLYIRLGSQAKDTIHWLIAAQSPFEIIASGELTSVEELFELTEKAQQRKVVAFVPGCDVVLKSLNVPAKSKRALRLATPFMLEDDLAQDVEDLFFAYANQVSDSLQHNCFVAIVNKNKMSLWLSWLQEAKISCKVIIPDFLALPEQSAVMLKEQVLLRQSQWQGITLEKDLWEVISPRLFLMPESSEVDSEATIPALYQLDAYSELPLSTETQACVKLNPMPEELPMALLAQHINDQSFNLLQGEYQVKQAYSPILSTWKWAAGFAAIALLFNVVIKTTEVYGLSDKIASVDSEIISTYKKAFPNTKRVRINTIKSQLKSKMSGLNVNAGEGDFLMMLDLLKPAFKAVPGLKPQTLKYDGKKQEIRLQAEAKDYQSFETFRQLLEKNNMSVSQGSQNNQGDSVSGSLSISKGKKA